MALTLPYPSQPALNSALASAPILANITAIAQAIQAFDGSQVNAGSIAASALKTSINPNTILSAIISSFVQSGCIWTTVSGLQGTMTGGTIYVGPSGSIYMVTVNGVGSYTFTASKDTYIDVDYNGNIYYSAVANGATAPSLTANSIRIAKVITSGTAISTITQYGPDGIGNPIYPIGALTAAKSQSPHLFNIHRVAALNTGGAATWSKVPFDTKDFDFGNETDITVNVGRFTATVAGYYFFAAHASTGAGSQLWITSFYKNGSEWSRGNKISANGSGAGATVADSMYLNVGDYVEVYNYTSVATLAYEVGATGVRPYFTGFMLSAI